MIDPSTLSVEELLKLKRLATRSLGGRRFEAYRPYPKQMEFFANGAKFRERLLMAANRVGKTYSAAYEVACHATGMYPPWWPGYRMDRENVGVAAGVTGQLVRDSMQQLLLGTPQGALGTGFIPADKIEDVSMARGIAGAADIVRVKHLSNGVSTAYFRAYEQGRERIQALTLDYAWADEEPPADYYMELLTRTNVAMGPVFMTFTPLLGVSEVVKRFINEGHGAVTQMSLHDVGHFTAEQVEEITRQYPAHERDARVYGKPALGSGAIFPIEESQIKCEPFLIPPHWPRLCAIDFGWTHPTGVVWGAWDRDTDTIYIYDAQRFKETTIPVVAAGINARGKWIPVAWPHDGYGVKDAMHGEPLAEQYRSQGVNMRPEHAHFPETVADGVPGGERKTSRISTEAGIQEMLARMQTHRWKVFSNLNDWFQEYRMYHRKNGLIVKIDDDLLSASRQLVMDIRHAIVDPKLISKQINHDRRSDWF